MDIHSLNQSRAVCSIWKELIDRNPEIWNWKIREMISKEKEELSKLVCLFHPKAALIDEFKMKCSECGRVVDNRDKEEIERFDNLALTLERLMKSENLPNIKKMAFFMLKYVNQWDMPSLPPWYFAIKMGDMDIIGMLERGLLECTTLHLETTLLHYAIHNECTPEMFQTLLAVSKNSNVNVYKGHINALCSETENTLLHCACKYGNKRIVQLLLNSGNINVNARNHGGNTPIHLACQGGHFEVVQFLASVPDTFGIDFTTTTLEGWTLLHVACKVGSIDIVRLLVKYSEKLGIDLDGKCHSGFTALHSATYYAAYAQSLHDSERNEIVAFLLNVSKEKGIDVNAEIDFFKTPFGCSLGREATIKLYLQKAQELDIDVTISAPGGHLNHGDECSVLHRSAEMGNNAFKTLFDYFIKHGHDVDVKSKFGRTPLHYACAAQVNVIIEAYEDLGQEIINTSDNDGRTPLHLACTNVDKSFNKFKRYRTYPCKSKLVKTLLEHQNIDLMARDHQSKTPLDTACQYGNPCIIKILTERLEQSGIDVNKIESYLDWKASQSAKSPFSPTTDYVECLEPIQLSSRLTDKIPLFST